MRYQELLEARHPPGWPVVNATLTAAVIDLAHRFGFNPAVPEGAEDPWLRITATVALRHIDWVTTLALHLGGGEDEVRLAPDVPVRISAVHWMETGQPIRLAGKLART